MDSDAYTKKVEVPLAFLLNSLGQTWGHKFYTTHPPFCSMFNANDYSLLLHLKAKII